MAGRGCAGKRRCAPHFLGAADDSGTRRGSGATIPDQQHRCQRVLSGAAFTPGGTFAKNILLERPKPQGKPIAATSAYTKKSTTVDGHAMTYVETGTGRPVVFIHGDVMSSFLWHNVIPYVAKTHRAIVIDLIGAGDSDKLPPTWGSPEKVDTVSLLP
jgi:alpha/beta hydrolase family protein